MKQHQNIKYKSNNIYTYSSVLLLFLLPALINIWLALQFGFHISALAVAMSPSLVLLADKQSFMKSENFYALIRGVVACLMMSVFIECITTAALVVIFPFMLHKGSMLLLYLASNLMFVVCAGLYFLVYRHFKGSFENVFSMRKKIQWSDFLLGFFGSVLFFGLFQVHILAQVPITVMCLALMIGFFTTGTQSLFEELTMRMAPLAFLKEMQKEGLSKGVAFFVHMVISTVVFALLHLDNFLSAGFYGIRSQAIFGFTTGLISWLTGGVEYTTGIHTANNLFIGLFLAGEMLNVRIAMATGYHLLSVILIDVVFLARAYMKSSVSTDELSVGQSLPSSQIGSSGVREYRRTGVVGEDELQFKPESQRAREPESQKVG